VHPRGGAGHARYCWACSPSKEDRVDVVSAEYRFDIGPLGRRGGGDRPARLVSPDRDCAARIGLRPGVAAGGWGRACHRARGVFCANTRACSLNRPLTGRRDAGAPGAGTCQCACC
jgi:hypothetical protein